MRLWEGRVERKIETCGREHDLYVVPTTKQGEWGWPVLRNQVDPVPTAIPRLATLSLPSLTPICQGQTFKDSTSTHRTSVVCRGEVQTLLSQKTVLEIRTLAIDGVEVKRA